MNIQTIKSYECVRRGPTCRITNMLQRGPPCQSIRRGDPPGGVSSKTYRRSLPTRLISKSDSIPDPMRHSLLGSSSSSVAAPITDEQLLRLTPLASAVDVSLKSTDWTQPVRSFLLRRCERRGAESLKSDRMYSRKRNLRQVIRMWMQNHFHHTWGKV